MAMVIENKTRQKRRKKTKTIGQRLRVQRSVLLAVAVSTPTLANPQPRPPSLHSHSTPHTRAPSTAAVVLVRSVKVKIKIKEAWNTFYWRHKLHLAGHMSVRASTRTQTTNAHSHTHTHTYRHFSVCVCVFRLVCHSFRFRFAALSFTWSTLRGKRLKQIVSPRREGGLCLECGAPPNALHSPVRLPLQMLHEIFLDTLENCFQQQQAASSSNVHGKYLETFSLSS